MASRWKLFVDSNFHTDMIKTQERIHKHHTSTTSRECRESRWPYTDKLTADQLTKMKDTYIGPRRTVSKYVRERHLYDSLYKVALGYDNRIKHDKGQYMKDILTHERQEDSQKPVSILANSAYGKRSNTAYDLTSADNRKKMVCKKNFLRLNRISTLPPLIGSVEHPHLPRYGKSM